MPLIEVKAGGPDIPDGVYPVILTDIQGPKTVMAQRGPKAGQEIDLLDWSFAIESGPHENVVISVSTSMASGPRSKMYAFLTALFGGRAPQIGSAFEKGDLIGRSALATVEKDPEGWLRITNLGALPAHLQTPQAAPVATQPVQAAAIADDAPPAFSPARAAVAAESSKVPF